MKGPTQQNLFNEKETNAVSIKEAASFIGVTPSTIRNWIKTKTLHQNTNGLIPINSLKKLKSNTIGQEKLTQRANKSAKDSHEHNSTKDQILKLALSNTIPLDIIGSEYEALLSNSFRNKEGIYYTPKHIVENLFGSHLKNISNATFCDPCCGSGNFIIRALELGFKPENIYGYDTDPVAIEITKSRLYELTGYKSNNIKQGDFLLIASNQNVHHFDYIYTNPPWGKKLPIHIRQDYGNLLKAKSSLDSCALFFFACLKTLKKGGVLGLLLPESFFNIASFEHARAKALQLTITRLIDYGKVFDGLVTRAQAIELINNPPSPHHETSCQTTSKSFKRKLNSFSTNPKSIINIECEDAEAEVLEHIFSIPHITLYNNASWGLGIVTGNNKKFITTKPATGYIPVYRGSDITKNALKEASHFIPSDLSLYQQVAPLELFKSKEKLIYKFISSRLCFFHDTKQRFVLNSANMMIPKDHFPISLKLLAQLLSSDFMNWVFKRIFNTHKILRGDLEQLPIFTQPLKKLETFNEEKYLNYLQITRTENGSYRLKEHNSKFT